MARTLEFVFAWLPVGCATEVRAAGVNHEQAIRCAIHPDAVFLLPLCIDTKRIVGGITDLERRPWLEESARKEEAEEGEEPRAQKCADSDPGQASSSLVNLGVLWPHCGDSTCRRCLRSPYCGSADVLVRRCAARRSFLGRFRVLLDRFGLRTRHEYLQFKFDLAPVCSSRRPLPAPTHSLAAGSF